MIDVITSLAVGFLLSSFVNIAIFGGLAFILTRRPDRKPMRSDLLILIFGMSMLGTCAGFTGGLSREPAVGAIIPAFFGLLGGVVLYIFGIDRTRGTIASILTACLSVSLFLSYVVSAQFRNYDDELRDLRTHCITAYSNADLIGNPTALAAFEQRFLPYCRSALDWNLDEYHRAIANGKPPSS